MRNIRVADPRDRVPTPSTRRPVHRRTARDVLATIPILLLVPVLVIGFAATFAADPSGTNLLIAGASKGPQGQHGPKPKASATAAPTAAPTAGVTPAPTATPTAAPTATPTSVPTAAPTAAPTNPAVTPASSGDYALIDRATLMALPMSGSSWLNLKSWADRAAGVPNLSDQNDQDDVVALAKSIVYARTGLISYRLQAIAMLHSSVGTEMPGDALGTARGVAPLALAADFLSWRDPVWMAWLRSLQTWKNPDRLYTLITTHDRRPNNWGTHGGASRIAVDMYLHDTADIARAAATFRGFLGDRSSYAGFTYGETSWQSSPSAPVGINPRGATSGGFNLDGIIPDDMRRGGMFPTVGAAGVSYTWEALQGAVLQAELLRRAGYPSWQWQDQAILRAFNRIYALGYPPTGDDDWQPALVNRRYGTAFPVPSTTHPGKSFGFADWLFG